MQASRSVVVLSAKGLISTARRNRGAGQQLGPEYSSNVAGDGPGDRPGSGKQPERNPPSNEVTGGYNMGGLESAFQIAAGNIEAPIAARWEKVAKASGNPGRFGASGSSKLPSKYRAVLRLQTFTNT
jgi:hypothetical protein